MRIALEKLIIDPEIQIRHGTREEFIQRYMEVLDEMPPIKVVRTKKGDYILADGFQRTAAAKRLGRKSLPVKFVPGDRKLALQIAAEANTTAGVPLTREERDDGIRRLRRLNPKWTNDEVAKRMHCAKSTVAYVLRRDEVREEIGQRAGIVESHLEEIGKLPAGQWAIVADLVQRKRLDTNTTNLLVRNLRDERLPAEFRERLLQGKEDPVVVNRDGSFSLPMHTVLRQVQQMTADDPALALEQALLMLARLRHFTWPQIHRSLDSVRAERLRSELPGYVAFLQEGLKPQFQILEGRTIK